MNGLNLALGEYRDVLGNEKNDGSILKWTSNCVRFKMIDFFSLATKYNRSYTGALGQEPLLTVQGQMLKKKAISTDRDYTQYKIYAYKMSILLLS